MTLTTSNTQEHLKKTLPGCKTRQVECDHHGEYTAIKVTVLPGGHEIYSECPGCKTNREKVEKLAKAAAKADASNRKIQNLFRQSAIPKRFTGRTLKNYRAENNGQQLALKIAQAYAERFEDRLTHGGGLVLCGKPGTGKTHLATAIAGVVMQTGRSALFLTVIKAVRSVKETYSRDSEKTERQAISALIQPDLLVLDEVGVQFGSEAEKIILYEIINGRYEEMRPTILISNLPEPELAKYIGDRVIDRMQEGGGAVISFDWDSYRKKVMHDESLPISTHNPVDWSDSRGFEDSAVRRLNEL